MEQQIEEMNFNQTLSDVGNFVIKFNEMVNLVNEMNIRIGNLYERINRLEDIVDDLRPQNYGVE